MTSAISHKPHRLLERPIGRCIYCDNTSPPFTDEHVLPQGLGGRWFLPEASCSVCQEETKLFEQDVQRGMLLPMRVRAGVRSRKRKPPSEMKMTLKGADGGTYQQTMPVLDVPITGIFPHFPPPQFLSGVKLEGEQPEAMSMYMFSNNALAEKAIADGHHGFQTNVPLRSFARMLAKIAHGWTVAEIGLDGFTPFLTDIVRGKATDWAKYVGCEHQRLIEHQRDRLHEIGFVTRRNAYERIAVVTIRLFANAFADQGQGTPIYTVVTGRLPLNEAEPRTLAPLAVLDGSKSLFLPDSAPTTTHHQGAGLSEPIPRKGA